MEDTTPTTAAAGEATEPRAKRERKQVEAYKVEEIKSGSAEVAVPAGSGVALGDIPHVEEELVRHKGDDDVLKNLFTLCFGAQGQKTSRKKFLRLFNGLASSSDRDAVEAKVLDNKKKWTVAALKDVCGVLGVEKSGSREELTKRVADFLLSPEVRKGVRSSTPKSKGTKRKRGSAKKTDGPKRAPSAFLLFSKANRDLAKSENPTASFGDVGRILGAMWRGLTEAERQTWTDAAKSEGGAAAEASGSDDEEEEEEGEGEGEATGGNDAEEEEAELEA